MFQRLIFAFAALFLIVWLVFAGIASTNYIYLVTALLISGLVILKLMRKV